MSLSVNDVLNGSFPGRNGVGACTLSGVKVGDIVSVVCIGTPFHDAYSQYFEGTISVAGQIQQTSAVDTSASTFNVVLLRNIGV